LPDHLKFGGLGGPHPQLEHPEGSMKGLEEALQMGFVIEKCNRDEPP
jgi:hypothetical protein